MNYLYLKSPRCQQCGTAAFPRPILTTAHSFWIHAAKRAPESAKLFWYEYEPKLSIRSSLICFSPFTPPITWEEFHSFSRGDHGSQKRGDGVSEMGPKTWGSTWTARGFWVCMACCCAFFAKEPLRNPVWLFLASFTASNDSAPSKKMAYTRLCQNANRLVHVK